MKAGSRELAIELVRIFARAGADRLADPQVQKLLASSHFYSSYPNEIETVADDIDRQLSPEGVRIRAAKFYPLPFRQAGKFELILFRPTFTNEWDGCKIEVVQIGAKHQGRILEMGYRMERGKNTLDNPHRFLHLQSANSFNAGGLSLDTPQGFLFGTPTFALNDSIMLAPIYVCLISYVGLSPNWRIGLIESLRQYSSHAGPYNFSNFQNNIKTTLHALLFQRGDRHPLSSGFERRWYWLQHKLNMFMGKHFRLS